MIPATLVILLGPRFLGGVVAGRLGPMLGGEVSIGSVRPASWGRRWIVSDLVLRAPGWTGEAGQVARLDRVEAEIEPTSLLGGDPVVVRVEVDGGVARLAEDPAEPGRFNVLGLIPPPASESTTTAPTISIARLRVESGDEINGRWLPSGRRHFSGSIDLDPLEPTRRIVDLVETDEAGVAQPGGLTMSGELDAEALEARLVLRDVDLGPDAWRIAPPSLRAWCDRLELDGRVDSIGFDWSPGGRLHASLAIGDVDLRLPDVGGEPWARFREGRVESRVGPPRMRVTEGLIEIDGDRLELVGVRGLLGDPASNRLQVPFSLGFSIDLLAVAEAGLDRLERRVAFEQVVRSAPFVLDLAIEDFGTVPVAPAAGPTAAIDLPLVAARLLEELGARTWELGTEIHLERGPALSYRDGEPIPGPVERRGRLRLAHGEGAYFRFPYPLADVHGELRFEGDEVEIVELRGRGPSGADVSITGDLLLPEDDVAVDIRIASPNLPVDGFLLDALESGPRRLLSELFDREAATRLASLGLLEDEASLAEARARRDLLTARLAAPTIDAVSRRGLETERTALERRLAAGPFRFAGAVEVDLRIEQGLGRDAPLITTGTIGVDGNGVLLAGFHYPVIAGPGAIRLEDERILLEGEGIPFTTPGGGRGAVSGVVDIPRRADGEGRAFEPRLSIRIPDDRLNPALLATIEPPAWIAGTAPLPRGWADLLDARGTIDLEGVLRPDPEGGLDPDWAFTATLDEVEARPCARLVDAIATLEVDWPAEATLAGIAGSIDLVPGDVRLDGLVGRLEQGDAPATVRATGRIRPREGRLDVEVDALDLDARTWLRATGGGERESIWWRRRAEGDLDARLELRRRDGEGEIVATLVGGAIEIDAEAATTEDAPPRLRLALESGEIEFAEIGTRFHDAAIVAGDAATPDRFVLSGTDPGGGGSWGLLCDWTDGDLGGPTVRTALAEFVPKVLGTWRPFAPAGSFSARIAVEGDADRAVADLRLETDDATIRLGDERVALATRRPLRVAVAPDRVVIGGVAKTPEGATTPRASLLVGSRLGEGPATRIEAGATVDLEAPRRLSLLGQLAFDALPAPGLAVLPAGVRATIEEIALSTDAPVEVDDLAIECRWDPEDALDAPSWIAANGMVRVEDASLSAGLEISQLEATADLSARRERNGPLELEASISADRLLVLGKELADVSTSLTWNEDLGRLRAAPIEGRLYGGFLHGDVEADLAAERFELELHLDEVAAGRLLAGEPESSAADRVETLVVDAGGRLRGRLQLEGRFGEAPPQPWRVGRGRVSIEQGRLARDPLSMSLLQLSQLMLPLNDSLADLDAAFHIENDRLSLESIALRCDTVVLEGDGVVDLATLEIDSVLEVRGRIPGFSDLLSPLVKLLYSVELKGPIADPVSSLRPLPGLVGRPAPPIRMTRVEENPPP